MSVARDTSALFEETDAERSLSLPDGVPERRTASGCVQLTPDACHC